MGAQGASRALTMVADKITDLFAGQFCRPSAQGLPSADIVSADPRYVELARGLNRRWSSQPRKIRLATCVDQVRRVVQEAVDGKRRLTVRSGGHCYEGFVYNADTEIVLDLSELDEVGYDARHNAISVGAGATLPSVYAALYRIWGVTLPGGSCSTVCAGGHIVGGGYGLLSRLHGLTVDHLYGVEVVVVDRRGRARVVVATRNPRDPHRDLWWAHTGGGGGNFGVVTRYLLKSPGARGRNPERFLPKPPAEVYLSTVALGWEYVDREVFTRLVRNFGDWHEANSGADARYAGLFGLLKLNKKTFDENGAATGQIVLLTQCDATAPDSRRLLDDYLDAVFAGIDVPRAAWESRAGEHEALPQYLAPARLPWLAATLQLGGSPAASRADYKSAYLRRGHTAAQIDATYEWLASPDYDNPNALVQIDSYGCRINAVAWDATAVAQRDSVLKIQYQSYWDDPADDERHLTWIRGMYRAIYAATGGVPAPTADGNTDGCFVNYPDIDLSDRDFNPDWEWSTLYYKGNYPRLQRIKRRYDPLDVFRHAQSIRFP